MSVSVGRKGLGLGKDKGERKGGRDKRKGATSRKGRGSEIELLE
jgi:hypothetical protein